jgi:hypothetical protein
MKIYKYPLEMYDHVIKMPQHARILCVQLQFGEPVLYAEVDPNNPSIDYHIEIFDTGQNIPSGMGSSRNYIGTFQTLGGQLVSHVYHYTGV